MAVVPVTLSVVVREVYVHYSLLHVVRICIWASTCCCVRVSGDNWTATCSLEAEVKGLEVPRGGFDERIRDFSFSSGQVVRESVDIREIFGGYLIT